MASTTPDLQTLLDERELLKEEVSTLSTQVKLLVRAEHALTRTRQEVDRQLQRIKLLADFALSVTGSEAPDEVFLRAQGTLLHLFEFDDTVAVRVGTERTTVQVGEVSLPLSADDAALLQTLGPPAVSGPDEPAAAMLLRTLTALGLYPRKRAPPSVLAWVPLRTPARGLAGVLLGWTGRQRSYHRDMPVLAHLPFLDVFATHVVRALDTAWLTTELRQQGTTLTETNQHLQRSLLDLERTQTQLVQAQKLEALGRLAGGIAHDFNNLLTVIVSHAEMLRPQVELQSEAVEDVQAIVEATQRATEITRRLLAFGRKQEDKQKLLDLNALTVDLSRLMRRLIGDDVVLQLDLDPSIGKVLADPVQIEQILMNLVVNARDAMPKGGRLGIETRWARAGDSTDEGARHINMVALSVIDEGTGMDEATRKQLFEPFFTTKPVGQGTGLGLATVYGLVNQNKGHITVDTTPGKGSRFKVLLPTVDTRPTRAPARPPPQRGRVMVVEDEDGIRRLVCRALRAHGFETVEARDGREAWELMPRAGQFDLLVTDVVMPSMTGPQLVKALRQTQPQLKVVFMSGHTFDTMHTDTLEPGLEAFLPKPFTPKELTALVDQLLEPERRQSPSLTVVGTG